MQNSGNSDNDNFDNDFGLGGLFDKVRNEDEDLSDVEPGNLDIHQVGLLNLVLLVQKWNTSTFKEPDSIPVQPEEREQTAPPDDFSRPEVRAPIYFYLLYLSTTLAPSWTESCTLSY